MTLNWKAIALIGGLGSAAITYALTRSVKTSALVGVGVGAVGGGVNYYMTRQSPAVGLLNVSRKMGRLGLYIPAPTVKKFSSFTGTRYYS